MKKSVLFILVVLLISLLSTGCGQPESAGPADPGSGGEEKIVLKYGTPLPEGHSHARADIAWMERIEEQTGGRVEFECYFGGTMISGNNSYTELVNGVVDVAWFDRRHDSTGFDLNQFAQHVFMTTPPEQVIPIFNQLWDKFPELAAEFEGVVLLTDPTFNGYQQLLSTKPVRAIADLKGLTLNASGSYIDLMVSQGAAAVSLGPPDWYMALQKNTIDGILLDIGSVHTDRFSEVIDYITLLNLTNGPELGRGMNKASWDKLPADIQEVFMQNKGFLADNVIGNFAEANQIGHDLALEVGIEIIELPEAEREKLIPVIEALQDEEAAELDAKGFPASELLAEARRLTK